MSHSERSACCKKNIKIITKFLSILYQLFINFRLIKHFWLNNKKTKTKTKIKKKIKEKEGIITVIIELIMNYQLKKYKIQKEGLKQTLKAENDVTGLFLDLRLRLSLPGLTA